MGNESIRIGLLFSLTGPTAVTETEQYQAASLAINEINEKGGINGRPVISFFGDIVSDPLITVERARKLIKEDKVDILVGTYTSACRKALLPVLEDEDILLIYPTLYEGSEENRWVFYTGALPNQQLQFFVPWIITQLGRTFYLISSDYIFPRETNKHIKRLVSEYHGEIIGESYHPLGNQYFEAALHEIERIEPDIIFSTLVGDSVVAFYKQYYDSGFTHPICSPITAETEIHALGPNYHLNLYSSFPYFSSVQTKKNEAFVKHFQAVYHSNVISSVMENAYNSIYLLDDALHHTDSLSTDSLRKALARSSFEAPQGDIRFDENNHHLWQFSRIGKVNKSGGFDIVWQSDIPIEPAPFLLNTHPNPLFKNPNTIQPDMMFLKQGQLHLEQEKWSEHFYFFEDFAQKFPYDFLLINQDGYLIEKFSNYTNIDFPIGSKWKLEDIGENGFGRAIKREACSIVTGCHHQHPLLKNLTTIGIPIKIFHETAGVLGIITNDGGEEELGQAIKHIGLYADIFSKLITERKKAMLLEHIVNGTNLNQLEGLIILYRNSIVFANNLAEHFVNSQPLLIDALSSDLAELSNRSAAEKHLRKRIGDEAYEIRMKRWEDFYFIFVKEGHKETENSQPATKSSFQHIIGADPSFLEAVHIAETAAKTDANVLIIGESGTGKELFANAIHNESLRKNQPFIAINCGAIPKELIHSELFGYTEGAFTGSKKGGKKGLFEEANGGTVFLDEIGEMPLDLQVTLLRVLQEREITRIGDHKPIPVDVRIIAATNKNLRDEIAYNGSFRSDLYYRLNVFQIELPPLRKRPNDIPELAQYFLMQLNRKNHTHKAFTTDTIHIFKQYEWPGNIREMENIIERCYYLSGFNHLIGPEFLDPYLRSRNEIIQQVGNIESEKTEEYPEKNSF
ncbi:hypothetical protein BpJC4_24120 [Weizmannia acidilactici]|uniref:transporter substrate-binding protein n=1 Tax=Weizmannia acidilactici TaxID=2607726 RepID=UPI00127F10F6|nr:transporter substrate-binding protein [Weizmannia acidilactici]GER67941.1 hypothetical protein BpJC4_24120 [Weizmannia acidilactici]